MRSFFTRTQRITTDIDITILLQDARNGEVLAGPVAGTLRNISEGGACVEVSMLLISGFHLFYQTLNTDAFSLLLQGEIPSKKAAKFSVAATSVWMIPVEEGRASGFQIGVQFRDRQPQLLREFKGK